MTNRRKLSSNNDEIPSLCLDSTESEGGNIQRTVQFSNPVAFEGELGSILMAKYTNILILCP